MLLNVINIIIKKEINIRGNKTYDRGSNNRNKRRKLNKNYTQMSKNQLVKELLQVSKADNEYPKNNSWNKYKNKRNISSSSFKCHECGKYGHFRKDCYKFKNKQQRNTKNYRYNKYYKNNNGNRYNSNYNQRKFTGNNKETKCFNCGKMGHDYRACKSRRNQSKINQNFVKMREKQILLLENKNAIAKGKSSSKRNYSGENLKNVFENVLTLEKNFKYRQLQELKFRKYDKEDDRTVNIAIENNGRQTVYFDGGSTMDIIDHRIAEPYMHLAQKCTKFGVRTAGGIVGCCRYIPLYVKSENKKLCVRWYILEGIDLPHKWIFSRRTLGKLNWTDILVKIDDKFNDNSYHNKHIIIAND